MWVQFTAMPLLASCHAASQSMMMPIWCHYLNSSYRNVNMSKCLSEESVLCLQCTLMMRHHFFDQLEG